MLRHARLSPLGERHGGMIVSSITLRYGVCGRHLPGPHCRSAQYRCPALETRASYNIAHIDFSGGREAKPGDILGILGFIPNGMWLSSFCKQVLFKEEPPGTDFTCMSGVYSFLQFFASACACLHVESEIGSLSAQQPSSWRFRLAWRSESWKATKHSMDAKVRTTTAVNVPLPVSVPKRVAPDYREARILGRLLLMITAIAHSNIG